MASSCLSLVTKPSSLFIFALAGLCLMLLVAVGSLTMGCIFFTSTFLIICTAYFTLFFSQNPNKDCKPNDQTEEEVIETVSEQVAAPHMQGLEGYVSIHRALNLNYYLPTVSENKSVMDDDQSITTNEDDEKGCRNVMQISDYNESSISDEDTLIEIELPTGHYLNSYKELEQYKFNNSKQNPHLLPEYYNWHQQSWAELLLEEDGLIEIDISMGSIMCTRFEIEAPILY